MQTNILIIPEDATVSSRILLNQRIAPVVFVVVKWKSPLDNIYFLMCLFFVAMASFGYSHLVVYNPLLFLFVQKSKLSYIIYDYYI